MSLKVVILQVKGIVIIVRQKTIVVPNSGDYAIKKVNDLGNIIVRYSVTLADGVMPIIIPLVNALKAGFN